MSDVLPTNEARPRVNQIAAIFDRVGATVEPVTFGSHRRPQAVIVPWVLWRQLSPMIEVALDLAVARVRSRTPAPSALTTPTSWQPLMRRGPAPTADTNR